MARELGPEQARVRGREVGEVVGSRNPILRFSALNPGELGSHGGAGFEHDLTF